MNLEHIHKFYMPSTTYIGKCAIHRMGDEWCLITIVITTWVIPWDLTSSRLPLSFTCPHRTFASITQAFGEPIEG